MEQPTSSSLSFDIRRTLLYDEVFWSVLNHVLYTILYLLFRLRWYTFFWSKRINYFRKCKHQFCQELYITLYKVSGFVKHSRSIEWSDFFLWTWTNLLHSLLDLQTPVGRRLTTRTKMNHTLYSDSFWHIWVTDHFFHEKMFCLLTLWNVIHVHVFVSIFRWGNLIYAR